MAGRLFEFQVGEEGHVTVNHAADLATGQTISAAAYGSSGAGLTVSGAASISGSQTTQKLVAVTAGMYRVDVTLTLAMLAASFPDYIFVRVSEAPAVV